VDDAQIRAITLLLLGLGVVALTSWFVYRRLGRVGPSSVLMPFLEHAEELRVRLLRTGIVLLLWMVLFLSVRAVPFRLGALLLAYPEPSLYDNIAAQVYRGIVAIAVPPGVQLFVSSPTEAVGAQMQIALVLALCVGLPLVLYEAWAFASPALASREQRFVRVALPAALVLFFAGAAFGFLVVVPMLFEVLYAFAAPLGATSLLSAGSLVGSVVTMCLLFGASFELPLIMGSLVRLGLASTRTYVRRWRHATIAIFVVAAFASDPTLLSQLIIGGILLALYWGGVLLSWTLEGRAPTKANIFAKTT
jgi:sec-independent protein translocase protein TatC